MLLMLVFGMSISLASKGIGSNKYFELVNLLTPTLVAALPLLPIAVAIAYLLRAFLTQWRNRRTRSKPLFISDDELITATSDQLELSTDAKRFAERIYNAGSVNSLVFGIDAPWGIGKSSFVNFCIEHWDETHRNQVIVYKFDLLRFSDRSNLFEMFVDGFVRTIQQSTYAPEIRPLFSNYSRFIKGESGISRIGAIIGFLPGNYTIDDALVDLSSALTRFDKKVVVVIDDLDRLSLSIVKDVLFAIKRSFMLPNVSYVLCYDSENIVQLEARDKDAEKVREFLEKFINVKTSLFLRSETLSKYVSDNFSQALGNNIQIDPAAMDGMKQLVGCLKEIYRSPDYPLYQDLLGDIRKLKRLLNTILLLDLEKVDFEEDGFSKIDLVHLLLRVFVT